MTILGHDLLAMTQQGFIQAFTRSVEWAATGDVKAPEVPVTPAKSPTRAQ
jgi:uncharacterized protein